MPEVRDAGSLPCLPGVKLEGQIQGSREALAQRWGRWGADRPMLVRGRHRRRQFGERRAGCPLRVPDQDRLSGRAIDGRVGDDDLEPQPILQPHNPARDRQGVGRELEVAAARARVEDRLVQDRLPVEVRGAQDPERGARSGEGVQFVQDPAVGVVRAGGNAQVDRQTELLNGAVEPPYRGRSPLGEALDRAPRDLDQKLVEAWVVVEDGARSKTGPVGDVLDTYAHRAPLEQHLARSPRKLLAPLALVLSSNCSNGIRAWRRSLCRGRDLDCSHQTQYRLGAGHRRASRLPPAMRRRPQMGYAPAPRRVSASWSVRVLCILRTTFEE